MLVGRDEKRRMTAGARAGFTLVELLVVTLIVVILCAIAYPVILKTQETARASECLSNMRQIGLGLHMYLDSYDRRFPSAVPYGAPSYWKSEHRATIQELLEPYIQNGMITEKQDGSEVYVEPGVFACPSDSGVPVRRAKFGLVAGKPAWKSCGSSYEYYASIQEDWLNGSVAVPWTGLSPLLDDGVDKERVGAPFSKIIYSTKKAVMGELYYWHMGDRTPDGGLAFTNALFADGHAGRICGYDYLEARIEQLDRWHSFTEIAEEN